jgi:hypothetical protein
MTFTRDQVSFLILFSWGNVLVLQVRRERAWLQRSHEGTTFSFLAPGRPDRERPASKPRPGAAFVGKRLSPPENGPRPWLCELRAIAKDGRGLRIVLGTSRIKTETGGRFPWEKIVTLGKRPPALDLRVKSDCEGRPRAKDCVGNVPRGQRDLGKVTAIKAGGLTHHRSPRDLSLAGSPGEYRVEV